MSILHGNKAKPVFSPTVDRSLLESYQFFPGGKFSNDGKNRFDLKKVAILFRLKSGRLE